MIFITSDTHFYHENCVKYDKRPFKDKYEMNDVIIKNWNSVVSEDDLVIHVGDFAFAGTKIVTEILQQLNGYKILVKGNHDARKHHVYKRLGFIDSVDTMIIEDMLLTHYPIYKINPFDEKTRKNFLYNKTLLALDKEKDIIKYVIHGHVHANPFEADERYIHYNVGVSQNNYFPISLNNIKKTFE